MNKQKGFGLFGILIIIFVIGVVGASGWYIWNQGQEPTNNKQKTETNPSFKTGNVYNIEFQYPNTWDIETSTVSNNEATQFQIYYAEGKPTGEQIAAFLLVTAENKNPENKDLWFYNIYNTRYTVGSTPLLNPELYENNSSTKHTKDVVTGVFSGVNEEGKTVWVRDYYSYDDKTSNTYAISFVAFSSEAWEKHKDDAKAVIESIKYTN